MVFTSTPDKENNKYYLGPAPLEDMARQIATAHGPCGNNRDYVFLLEKAMFDLGHEDDMVIELTNGSFVDKTTKVRNLSWMVTFHFIRWETWYEEETKAKNYPECNPYCPRFGR